MNVIFKNVGQGDTIIIEWEVDSVLKVGIIDCKLNKDSTNPVIKYLEEKNIVNISFIILTHPHRDHYDGIVSLLKYILESNNTKGKKIGVDELLHTFSLIIFWEKLMPKAEMDNLEEFYYLKQELVKKKIIKEANNVSGRRSIELSNLLNLTFWSPTNEEEGEFINTIRSKRGLDKHHNTKAVNILSTIIQIESKGKYILFTADSKKFTFNRLLSSEYYKKLMEGKQLQLIQVPHHGSFNNFHKEFWHKINRINSCDAVISVGERYKTLPSLKVLQYLHEYGFSIKCTNITNGALFFYKKYNEKARALSISLNDNSSINGENKKELNYTINW